MPCRDVFNVFLGAMLGGSIISELTTYIDNPGQIWKTLSSAIPASSNFFVNYVIYRALVMAWFRLFYPHQSVVLCILKWLRIVPCKFPPVLSYCYKGCCMLLHALNRSISLILSNFMIFRRGKNTKGSRPRSTSEELPLRTRYWHSSTHELCHGLGLCPGFTNYTSFWRPLFYSALGCLEISDALRVSAPV